MLRLIPLLLVCACSAVANRLSGWRGRGWSNRPRNKRFAFEVLRRFQHAEQLGFWCRLRPGPGGGSRRPPGPQLNGRSRLGGGLFDSGQIDVCRLPATRTRLGASSVLASRLRGSGRRLPPVRKAMVFFSSCRLVRRGARPRTIVVAELRDRPALSSRGSVVARPHALQRSAVLGGTVTQIRLNSSKRLGQVVGGAPTDLRRRSVFLGGPFLPALHVFVTVSFTCPSRL